MLGVGSTFSDENAEIKRDRRSCGARPPAAKITMVVRDAFLGGQRCRRMRAKEPHDGCVGAVLVIR